MTTPLNGSTEQIAARAMTNDTLAHRVSMLVSNRRSFDKKLADAILAEAATRLTWPDNYAKHVDAGKVDRMKAATESLVPTCARCGVSHVGFCADAKVSS